MELIKKKIRLEDGISRNPDTTYGDLTATTFYAHIFLTQDMDNMGIFTDINYENTVPDYSILLNKLTLSGLTFQFMNGQSPSVVLTGYTKYLRLDNSVASDWYKDGDVMGAITETRRDELKSYNKTNRFIPNFNLEVESYLNYQGTLINGVTRITEHTQNPTGFTTTYTFDGNNDITIGTPNQTTGLLYTDVNRTITNIEKGTNRDDYLKNKTRMAVLQYKAEGWNETNTSLSALTKEEYLMGILYPPEVFSDVNIDRGSTTVMEKHLKLSEVESIDHLEWFGNGFYNIVKI
jgi:hypothetical protein